MGAGRLERMSDSEDADGDGGASRWTRGVEDRGGGPERLRDGKGEDWFDDR